MRRSSVSLYVGVPLVLVIWVVFVVALSKAGFLDLSGEKPEAQVLAGGITLVGAFLGTLVSLLGLILKHTLDEEAAERAAQDSKRDADLKETTEARLRLEGNRNSAAQDDAERRLKLEAGLRAVQLFASPTGSAALPVQYSGALFTLASLGQHELTLSLADFLLRQKDGIDPGTASAIIDRALRDGSPDEKRQAINVLNSHVGIFFTPDDEDFPRSVMQWKLGSEDYIREWAVVALGRAILTRKVSEWKQRLTRAYAFLGALALAWKHEKNEGIRADAGVVLKYSLIPFPDIGVLSHPREYIDMEQIRGEVEGLEPTTSFVDELATRLKEWAAGKDVPTQQTPIASN